MKLSRNEDLVQLLSDGHANLRMLALHLLCEGYASDRAVFDKVLEGWKRWSAEEAFPEFPMLSYFGVPHDCIEKCLDCATQMVKDRKLTHPVTRCAGKLIEQMVKLPPDVLLPHLSRIESIVTLSKIFFRVDLDGLRERISFVEKSADELAQVLNASVATLCKQPNDHAAGLRGIHALEALRAQHPGYLDLHNVFAERPPSAGSKLVSFELALQSVIAEDEPGLDGTLGRHLTDGRESVYSNIVEALVRSGSAAAVEALLESLLESPTDNQRWIARGMQRIRVPGLSNRISELRDRLSDPSLWLMLLIAEVRQFDPTSAGRIAAELERLQSFSETLIDSLTIYARLNEDSEDARIFQQSFMDYIQRSNRSLADMISRRQASTGQTADDSTAKLWQMIVRNRNKN